MIALFLLVSIMIYINCNQFTLRAGIKSEGYCIKEDFIFSFENSFYLNSKFPKKKIGFKLLMDKNIISICNIKNKNILSNNFDVLCRIKNFNGCLENISFSSPKLGNIEPENIILENGDIIHFEGFTNLFQDRNKKPKLINENEIIVKEPFEEGKFIFYIVNSKYIKTINKEFTINVKISNKNKVALCSRTKENLAKNLKIKCIINESINNYEKIEIIENHEIKSLFVSEEDLIELIPGSISKDINNKTGFYIINNTFSVDISKEEIEDNKVVFKMELDYNEKNVSCFLDKDSLNKKKININCAYPDKITEPKSIIITNVIKQSEISSTKKPINFDKFVNLSFYTLTLGKIVKGNNSEENIYSFKLVKTIISKSLELNKWFYLKVSINNEEKESICKIQMRTIEEFDMGCTIQNYSTPDNYDIIYKQNNYFNYTLLAKSTFYFETLENISTTTLTAGYIQKESCINSLYYFTIRGNKINGKQLKNLSGNLLLKLNNFDNEISCSLSSNLIIGCRFNIEEKNKDYCDNIYKDIKIEKLIGNNYILIEDNILYLYGFEDLETITVEAGNLFKGNCHNNAYIFSFNQSKVFNEKTNKINFSLQLSKPNINANCEFILNKETDIICNIIGIDSCPIFDIKSDLLVKINPINQMMDNKRIIYYRNFDGKSTITTISSGKLKFNYDNENKIIGFNFSNSNVDYNFRKEIIFNIHFKMNEKPQKTNCFLLSDEKNINCNINNIDEEVFYIKIENNPIDDYDSLDEKTIVFTNFEGKEINTLKAGKIEKGKCQDNSNYYYFYFNNSWLNYSIENINKNFTLQMKAPNRKSICMILKVGNIDSLYNIKCFIEGYLNCPIDEEDDIIVDIFEPEPIQINDNYSLYFSSFGYQSTLNYTLSVENLIKLNKTDKCKYYFTFSKIKLNPNILTKELVFDFDILFNEEKYKAECILTGGSNINNDGIQIDNLSCSFDLNKEICSNNDLLNYDLKIEDNIEKNITIKNPYQNINFEGFSNKETITLFVENIKEKILVDNIFKFKLKIDKNITVDLAEDKNNFKINFFFSENNKNLEAYCIIENNIIICESEIKSLNSINDDIIIKEWPTEVKLKNKSIYFRNNETLGTFTIIGGFIQKLECKEEGQDYYFNLMGTKSTKNIPESKEFEMEVKINKSNETNKTFCTIIQDTNEIEYSMKCWIKRVNCIQDITLPEDSIKPNPNIELFSPNSTFFYDFNNKSAFTIKAGKLEKGQCKKIQDNKEEYCFNFINNTITYNNSIEFNLTFVSKKNENNEIKSICQIKIENNTILCKADKCPNEIEDDIKITQIDKYAILNRDTIWYEGFLNSETTTIINQGMIIKEKFYENEKKVKFLLTDNIINENKQIELEISLTIKNTEEKALCKGSKPENQNNFNLSCFLNSSNIEDDIEIINEPKDDNYYFFGYKNKKTLTVESGQISIYLNANKKFEINNNKFIGDASKINNETEIKLNIKYSKNKEGVALCKFILKENNCNKTINISCDIQTVNEIDELGEITIEDNPMPIILDNKFTSLNFINFKQLTLYNIKIGKIIKGECNSNKYTFILKDTILFKSIIDEISLELPIIINNERKISNCTIINNSLIFDMYCEIDKFDNCPNKYYNIKIEKQFIFNDKSLKPNTIYANISNDISTITLSTGYIIKGGCKNGEYLFGIHSNSINDEKIDLGKISQEFSLKIENPKSEGFCSINPTNKIISCSFNIEKDDDYCTNINKDIKKGSLRADKYIIINDYILHLYGFESLETITVEAGDLERGDCNGDIYEFNLTNSKIYNDIQSDKEIIFPLQIKEPISINSNCYISNNLTENNNFTIICKIIGSNNICPIMPPDKDLIIGSNPGYRNISSKVINFSNFPGKSTIITITAGILSRQKYNKEEKKYYLLISENTIDYILNKDYEFKIVSIVNGNKENINCTFEIKSKNILCILSNIESDNANIKIVKNPLDDIESIDKKTIIFKDFENKEIITFAAGKLVKGKCEENSKIYKFSFKDSNSKVNVTLVKPILLKMKVPDKFAICEIKNDNYEVLLHDLDCIIEGTNSCPIEYNETDIIVGDEEPQPIRISSSLILYFSFFAGKNSLEYSLILGNLLKSGISGCKYYFTFSNVFILDFNYKSILFSFDLLFNKKRVRSNCKLYNTIEQNNSLISCYVDLGNKCENNNYLIYDLEIGENINISMDDFYNIQFEDLSNKKTNTILAGNIKDKYIENNKFIFIIENNEKTYILKELDNFHLEFNVSDNNQTITAECELFEENNIKCKSNISLSLDKDFSIITNPKYQLLNGTSIYFEKFQDLKTFTIRVGQIQKNEKNECKEGENYTFNITNNISSDSFPDEAEFKINLKIDNEKNYPKTAICQIKKKNIYFMSCTIENVGCVKDIILEDNIIEENPNKDIFKSYTTFFYGFNNKRTITVIAGKLIKGKCNSSQENKSIYNFSFENNTYTYNTNKHISFDLDINISKSPAKCNLTLSGNNKTIVCSIDMEYCPEENYDIKIISNPEPNYDILAPHSIWYESFINKTTITINMNLTGKLIKGELEENELSFIITDNFVNDTKEILELKDFEIQIDKTNENPICNIVQIEESSNTFDIKCKSKEISINDEIIIIENPTYNNDYYFYGYKDKRTLTLEAGSIEKDQIHNQTFNIIKNKFIGDMKDIIFEKNITFEIKYSDEIISNTSCNINFADVVDNYLDIICNIPNNIEIKKTKTITIMHNPDSFLLPDNKTTLNLINFKNLTLYTLTLGKILKDKCYQNSFVFYFVDTIISKPLNSIAYLTLPIIINNENEERNSSCQIEMNVDKFKMHCIISNYCPNDNIDIKVLKNKIYLNKISLSQNSILIDIPEDILTTTLKAGYFKKINCINNLYVFTINGNILSGFKVKNINAKYKLKISQFEKEASCSINPDSYVSFCSLNINEENEEEKSFCENINKDIKVQNIIGDYYFIIDDNIVHFYGFNKLESYTIEAGDLKRGYCIGNSYEFKISNSKIYNNLLNENEIAFSLNLIEPEELNARCILSIGLKINYIFDINCSIIDKCPIAELEIGGNNPNDILLESKRVIFKNFTKKSTIVNIYAGMLTLEKVNNKYYLYFINSNFDYELNEDFSFNLFFELNQNKQKEKCRLDKKTKIIICDLNNLKSNDIDIDVKIKQNPNDNYDYLESKTIVFSNFTNKEIHTFIAGQIEKGGCNNTNYTFHFINSTSQYLIQKELEFYLQMKSPNRIAICKIPLGESIFDIKCNIEGTSTCPIELDDDIIVGDSEPSIFKINDSSILYFSSFAGKSTNNNIFYLYGGILTKKSVEVTKNENIEFKFYISDCLINKDIDEDIQFEISVNLEIYDKFNKTFISNCFLKNGISNLKNFNIECSISISDLDYIDIDSYDFKIISGDQQYHLDNDKILFILKLDGLSTITLHNCKLLKGNCNNKKYLYKFSSCILPQQIILEEDLEFKLKIKNNESSSCVITSSNQNEIQCEIEHSKLCEDNNIEIGNNEPEIDYSKYYNLKNFYISGLKNLYTTTLTGGLLNFGKCLPDSVNYTFNFTNTILSKELLSKFNFELEIEKPSKMKSICIIPQNSKDFTLNCTINGVKECPLSDEYSLKIKEIKEEYILNSTSKNTIYIKNMINRNIITINSGEILLGECYGRKYRFSFENIEILGDIEINQLEKKQFSINLKNPQTISICEFNLNSQNPPKIYINCYIEDEEQCPIFKYTYLETGENDPSIDDSIIYPSLLKLSNFKNQIKQFENYYITISESQNEKCINENYEFDLFTHFKSSNIKGKKEFSLTLQGQYGENYNAKCIFPNSPEFETSDKIHCIINDTIDSNIDLFFDYSYLEEEGIYIINLGNKKNFKFNNVECPLFNSGNETNIKPEKSILKNNSFVFDIKIKTSYTKEEKIKIFYNNGTEKNENILEFLLIPLSGLELVKSNNEKEIISKCKVPDKTQVEIKFSCSADNITDLISEYFILDDTKDIIKVSNNEIVLKGIRGIKIENIYKSDIKPDPGPEPDPYPEPPNNQSNGKSKVGKVILIIIIILIFIIIIVILLYFLYFKHKDESSIDNENSSSSLDKKEEGEKEEKSEKNNKNQDSESVEENSHYKYK